jgi:magnesium-transporting ATPase (P-type)
VDIEEFSLTGLRTLGFSVKFIDKKDYEDWKKIYDEACSDMEKREEKVSIAENLIEQDLTMIGVSAVEDLLQDNVAETITAL